MKTNQKGIVHLQLIVGLVLVLGVVGFAAYRVGQSNSSNQANIENDSEPELAEGIKVNEEEVKEVDLPKEEPEKVVEPVPAQKPVEKVVENPVEKKDKVYLNISSVNAAQDGAIVYVHSKIEKAVSGTCNFKLYREGFDKNHVSNKISNSQDCFGELNVASMPNYEGWSLHVWFDGDDGKTYAYQQEVAFPLTNPN